MNANLVDLALKSIIFNQSLCFIQPIFVVHPTDQTSVAQGLIFSGSRRRAVAQTRAVALKMFQAPSTFP